MIEEILNNCISEESAAAWWLKRYTGSAERIIHHGRLNKRGTPLYDTNWLPAAASIACVYREMGWTVAKIARTLGKSHHAVTDLFLRIAAAEKTA
jgi:hypothetical protein